MRNNVVTIPIFIGSLLCAFLVFATSAQHELGNVFSIWVLSVIIVAALQYFSVVREKARKLGADLATKHILKNQVQPNLNEKNRESQQEHQQNFFQEACELMFIGEYVALLLSALPLLIVVFTYNRSPEHTAINKGEIVFVTIITFIWLLTVEKLWKVKLCTPHIPIPLKWVIIPLGIFCFATI